MLKLKGQPHADIRWGNDMATHKLGKLRFRFEDKGLEFKWGDGEIRRLGLKKKPEEPEYEGAYDEEYDAPSEDDSEMNYGGSRFADDGDYEDAVDDSYADDGYDSDYADAPYDDGEADDYADDYEDGDYAEEEYADDEYSPYGYDADDGDQYEDSDYGDADYDDGEYLDDADEEAYVEYDEDGNPYYPDEEGYPEDAQEGYGEYGAEYPEGWLGTALQYADENDWVTYVLLFVLPPLGIYLLWRRQRFEPTIRYVLSACSAVWFIVMIVLLAMSLFGGQNDRTKPGQTPTLAPEVSASATVAPSATASVQTSAAPSATTSASGTGSSGSGGLGTSSAGTTDAASPSATPITGGGSATTTSNLVWVSSTSLLYHRSETCELAEGETLSQTTLDAAKQRQKGECPVCYNGTTYYATSTGKWYHTDKNCSRMSDAVVFPVELADTYGKDPCPVCVTKEKKTLDEVNTSVFITSSTEDQSGIKVWCTSGGKNYHMTSTCRNMEDAKQVSLKDALLAGKTACSTCCAASGTYVYCRKGGTYFHKASSCGSSMKNGEKVTLAEALVLGKKQCPDCLPQTSSSTGSNQTTGEYYVYAADGGKYYHIKSNCSNMTKGKKVTLKSMLEEGRPACPDCCPGASMSVYAAEGGTYYHSYATCNGMENAKEGTLAQALALGYQKCPRCWGSTASSSSNSTSSESSSSGSDVAYTATSDSVMVYARQDGKYYHTKSNCSGMSNASHISLKTAIEAGKTACPTCASMASTLVYSREDSKWYHKIADCQGMKNADRRTVADALMLGQTACPECWTAAVVDEEGDPLPSEGEGGETSTTPPKTDSAALEYTVGTSGIKVYSTQSEQYFHLKSGCGGKSGRIQVALETALNYGKTACPDCASVAKKTVYATASGKYYHASKNCAGTGAVGGTLAQAVAMGFKPCPYCVAISGGSTSNGSTGSVVSPNEPTGGTAANFTAGTSGVKVYASANGKYYHAKQSCAGSGAMYVTLETALNYGKSACPECCSVAEKTVYAVPGSSTYHIRKSCAGSDAVSGSFAKALASGLHACSKCFTPTSESESVAPGAEYSASASTGVYVDLYAEDYYYHTSSKCSKTGMSGGTEVTLQFVKDLGYHRCPYCNPPSDID